MTAGRLLPPRAARPAVCLDRDQPDEVVLHAIETIRERLRSEQWRYGRRTLSFEDGRAYATTIRGIHSTLRIALERDGTTVSVTQRRDRVVVLRLNVPTHALDGGEDFAAERRLGNDDFLRMLDEVGTVASDLLAASLRPVDDYRRVLDRAKETGSVLATLTGVRDPVHGTTAYVPRSPWSASYVSDGEAVQAVPDQWDEALAALLPPIFAIRRRTANGMMEDVSIENHVLWTEPADATTAMRFVREWGLTPPGRVPTRRA